jgi:hypothetical protein
MVLNLAPLHRIARNQSTECVSPEREQLPDFVLLHFFKFIKLSIRSVGRSVLACLPACLIHHTYLLVERSPNFCFIFFHPACLPTHPSFFPSGKTMWSSSTRKVSWWVRYGSFGAGSGLALSEQRSSGKEGTTALQYKGAGQKSFKRGQGGILLTWGGSLDRESCHLVLQLRPLPIARSLPIPHPFLSRTVDLMTAGFLFQTDLHSFSKIQAFQILGGFLFILKDLNRFQKLQGNQILGFVIFSNAYSLIPDLSFD